MKKNLKKSISNNMTDSVVFRITPSMVESFIALTGDRSSLHTDSVFARKTQYREIVVHGMLPLMFLAVLKHCDIDGCYCAFNELSANFIKPVSVNETLEIRSSVVEIDDENNCAKTEYTIFNQESKEILITGHAERVFRDTVEAINEPKTENPLISGSDAITERSLLFGDIKKGEKQAFRFMIRPEHAYRLSDILANGLVPDRDTIHTETPIRTDLRPFLALSMLSTFVGMCLPGKYGVFLNFHTIMNEQPRYDTEYTLEGTITYTSKTASTVVENIVIFQAMNPETAVMESKVHAMVNKPPKLMPSLDSLKQTESDFELHNKVILITGASRGIGEVTAKLFSIYGAKVVINYLGGHDDAERVVEEIRSHGGEAIAIQADVSNREDVKNMVETACGNFGTIDILVNNAVRGIKPSGFMNLTWDDMQKDIDVTVKGTFNCCQEIIPLMIENSGGSIVNISTVYTEDPPEQYAHYVTAKSALTGMTRSLAVELMTFSIRVNIVVPSIVETDLTSHVPDMFLDKMRKKTPLKRLASPVDVARAVIFLASSQGSFTTGQKIMVTGGNLPFL